MVFLEQYRASTYWKSATYMVAAFLLALMPLKAQADTSMADFTFQDMSGNEINLGDYHGKAVLIVNTASQCGFTKQYGGLQSLWERYRERGLVVLAVPSNDFGGQEPLENHDIKRFCEINYDIDFPIMSKISVKGDNAHPFYQHVSKKFGFSGSPKWNFHKYLINADGKVVDWFSSITSPESGKLIAAIEKALPVQYASDKASR